MLKLDDSLDKIALSKNIEDLRQIMRRRSLDLGYTEFSYLDIRKFPFQERSIPFFISTASEDFLDTYVSESFFRCDPVVRRAARSNALFTWSDCPEYYDWRRDSHPENRSHRVMRVADEFGYTDGCVIPIHAVDSSGLPASALFTLFWRDHPSTFERAASAPAWLRLVAFSMHEKILQFRGLSANERELPPLTERECECLLWTCRGKTRGETGDILKISDRTVEFHLQSVKHKLRVGNTLHAVVKAVRMGLIVP